MKNSILAVAAAVLLAATFQASAEEDGKRSAFKDRPHPSASRMIQKIDRDGDGRIGAGEFMGQADARAQDEFTRMDTDGDGAISADEFRAAAIARATEMFSRLDRDADGRITDKDFFRGRKHGMHEARGHGPRHGRHEGGMKERRHSAERPAPGAAEPKAEVTPLD